MNNAVFIWGAFCALVGCSNVAFNSNVGPPSDTFVKSLIVKKYEQPEIAKYDATPLGIVASSYCHQELNRERPSERSVMRDLKQKAQDKGANGIVLESCYRQAQAGCTVFMECEATAYLVPERKSLP